MLGIMRWASVCAFVSEFYCKNQFLELYKNEREEIPNFTDAHTPTLHKYKYKYVRRLLYDI